MEPFNAIERRELTHEEYLWAASATMADVFEIDAKINDKDKKLLRCLHGAMGIVTEVGELMEAVSYSVIDLVNLAEEIGDVLWYIAIFEREYEDLYQGYMKPVLGTDNMPALLRETSIVASGLMNIYKRRLFYSAEVQKADLAKHLLNIKAMLLMLMRLTHKTEEEIRAINIKKLWLRFDIDYTKINAQTDLFKKENAINRDTNKERAVLEGN